MKRFFLFSLLIVSTIYWLDSGSGEGKEVSPTPTRALAKQPTPSSPKPAAAPTVTPIPLSPGGTTPSPEPSMGDLLKEMADMLARFFGKYAALSYQFIARAYTHATEELKPALGLLLCARDLLAIIGLYIVLTARRMLRRFGS